jgi:molybdopterin biosynthesis enzyme
LQYLGISRDCEEALEHKIRVGVQDRRLDVIIATGGVSMGKFDGAGGKY